MQQQSTKSRIERDIIRREHHSAKAERAAAKLAGREDRQAAEAETARKAKVWNTAVKELRSARSWHALVAGPAVAEEVEAKEPVDPKDVQYLSGRAAVRAATRNTKLQRKARWARLEAQDEAFEKAEALARVRTMENEIAADLLVRSASEGVELSRNTALRIAQELTQTNRAALVRQPSPTSEPLASRRVRRELARAADKAGDA